MSLRGRKPEATSYFSRYFKLKGDCRVAKEQEPRLAKTSNYEMTVEKKTME